MPGGIVFFGAFISIVLDESFQQLRRTNQRGQDIADYFGLRLSAADDRFEPSIHHAFYIEWHVLGIAHFLYALVPHDLFVDAVTMGARLVNDVSKRIFFSSLLSE